MAHIQSQYDITKYDEDKIRAELEAEIAEEIRIEKEFRQQIDEEFGSEDNKSIFNTNNVELDFIQVKCNNPLIEKTLQEIEESEIAAELKRLDELMNIPIDIEAMKAEIIAEMIADFGDINESRHLVKNNQSPETKVEENAILGYNKIIGIHQLNRVTSAYLDYLLNSYIDLLLSMDSKLKLCEWVDVIFDNKHLAKVKLIIENGETLDDSKQDLVTYIVNEFIFETYNKIIIIPLI